jgi:hypothetical protein
MPVRRRRSRRPCRTKRQHKESLFRNPRLKPVPPARWHVASLHGADSPGASDRCTNQASGPDTAFSVASISTTTNLPTIRSGHRAPQSIVL